MFSRKLFLEQITDSLLYYVRSVEEKAKLGLLDDAILSENFIAILLNTCHDWNLINLNQNMQNFPGIDLGDVERKIGVQVTLDKSGVKIKDSLDTIVRNHIDLQYNMIYFFIIGTKQKSYHSVDFTYYNTLHCSEKNIWDISDLLGWCSNYDIKKLNLIHKIIEQEFFIYSSKPKIDILIKRNILELKNTVDMLLNFANQLKESPYVPVVNSEKITPVLAELDQLLPYVDSKTYLACRQMLEEGLQLNNALLTQDQQQKWRITGICGSILRKAQLGKVLQEAMEFINNDIQIMQNGIDLIIDGYNLFERLHALKIDSDILYGQFSLNNFIYTIETVCLRKIRSCMIVFTKTTINSCFPVIGRLEAEGIKIKILESMDKLIEFINRQANDVLEIMLISTEQVIIESVCEIPNKKIYLYTIDFCGDLPGNSIPLFYCRGLVNNRELNFCFKYDECNKINIKNISEDDIKYMFANANDNLPHQLRVDWNGDIYISTSVAADDVNPNVVKFRWETWDAGNGYVGPQAASDSLYMKSTLEAIKKCWKRDIKGYCDVYNGF